MSGIDLQGMVLLAAPSGEYDRRIVLLTKERGKITAFARSARKPNSSLLAATVPFSFGTFHLYEGRSAYTCVGADITNYFDELKTDFEGAYYGFYFMEFAAYYAQENMDGTQMLNLLYAALLALENPALDNRAVRYAYEVRLMVQGGEFPQDVVKDESLSKGARYAFWYMISAPLSRLFAFRVSDEVLGEIEKKQDKIRGKLIDRTFRSLGILDSVTNIH
ncbi:MAG TPA: DNA repair protein RecO [Lachnospiraceae bacterium]|jgi:DNA repair protein RecO (recombination protein O)|nr:DNA repair protein RecO [Lachnospiraceae bacterium]HCG59085.1 DNA repair protein RecO [Lachnospiraceae bacterium]HCI83533.1 DNA repair protein RecO [Lachnospiraceae bacterium]